MANEYEELVAILRHMMDDVIARQFAYTAALLGDGQGNVDVPDREGFSYVRPDRASNKFVEMLNKTVVGGDGLPIVVGRYPWQPDIRQVLSVDWATYLDVGWDDEFGGLGKHGESHQWPDGKLKGTDTFHVYLRQLYALRAEPAGSSYPLSVQVRPYGQKVQGGYKFWPSTSILDLSGMVPSSTGSSRYALVYWNPLSGGTYGSLGAVTGTLAVGPTSVPAKPVSPEGTIPSAFVYFEGGQASLDNTHFYDAREIMGSGGDGITILQVQVFS